MADANRVTTPATLPWSLVDCETGAVNHEIGWKFRVGDSSTVLTSGHLCGRRPPLAARLEASHKQLDLRTADGLLGCF
jgi:hypothetical protein